MWTEEGEKGGEGVMVFTSCRRMFLPPALCYSHLSVSLALDSRSPEKESERELECLPLWDSLWAVAWRIKALLCSVCQHLSPLSLLLLLCSISSYCSHPIQLFCFISSRTLLLYANIVFSLCQLAAPASIGCCCQTHTNTQGMIGSTLISAVCSHSLIISLSLCIKIEGSLSIICFNIIYFSLMSYLVSLY